MLFDDDDVDDVLFDVDIDVVLFDDVDVVLLDDEERVEEREEGKGAWGIT